MEMALSRMGRSAIVGVLRGARRALVVIVIVRLKRGLLAVTGITSAARDAKLWEGVIMCCAGRVILCVNRTAFVME